MSENKKYFYLKLKDSFFSSEEMLVLESVPDGMIYQNIYLRMCLLSLKNEGALTFKNMLPYDLKMLATVLRVDIAKMKMALELFEQLGLVTKTDNEVLFMSDIQALIGQSSTEAERIAKYRKRIADSNNVTEMLPDNECTKSVQMLQTCTPKIELEKELKTEKKKDIEQEESPAPSYIPKTEYKKCNDALREIHKLILSHNEMQTENKKKISICKDFFYFSQNEARSFIELFKRAKPVEVIEALKNYLIVASADVYISSFSINAFCKNFNNYTPEYFDMAKYIDAPKGGLDELAENTVNEMIEAGYVFRIPVFYKHKEEWFNMGMPKGEKLVQIVKEWTDKEDNQ